MKNMKFEKKAMLWIMIGVTIMSIAAGILSVIAEGNNIPDDYFRFTFDEKTGKTIPVGKGSENWIPVEKYEALYGNGVEVFYESEKIVQGEKWYTGRVDGKTLFASEGYWNSVILSKQPEQWFGYVYVGNRTGD